MCSYNQLKNELISKYRDIRKNSLPEWAVHKISPSNTDKIVVPTIPFIGKHYAEQKTKILVYASAEVLTDYCYGQKTDRPWLDEDEKAENRHRKCFDESISQPNIFFPNVHITPMNDGALATAVMYLTTFLRDEQINEPRSFYETIAIGNYGKFSIETEYQYELRMNTCLSDEERRILKKEKQNINKDYAGNIDFLKASHEYIRADIDLLKPDYIIMPKVEDKGFLDSIISPHTKKIEIYQMGSTVINNMGLNGRNNPNNIYKSRDIEQLPNVIQRAYQEIKGINHEKYSYVFDYLDKKISHLLKK